MQVRNKDLYRAIRDESNALALHAKANNPLTLDIMISDLKEAIEKRLTIPNVDRIALDIRCLDTWYWQLADLYSSKGMHAEEAEAIKHAKNMLFMFKSFEGMCAGKDNDFEGQYYFSLGLSYVAQGLNHKAIKQFTKAVEHFEMYNYFDSITAFQFAKSMVMLTQLSEKFDPEVYKKAIGVLEQDNIKSINDNDNDHDHAKIESLIQECKMQLEKMTQKAEPVSARPKADEEQVEQASLSSAAVNPSTLFAGSAQKSRRREPEVDVSLIIPERKTRSGKRFGQ